MVRCRLPIPNRPFARVQPLALPDPEQTLAQRTMNDGSAPIQDVLDEVATTRNQTFISIAEIMGDVANDHHGGELTVLLTNGQLNVVISETGNTFVSSAQTSAVSRRDRVR